MEILTLWNTDSCTAECIAGLTSETSVLTIALPTVLLNASYAKPQNQIYNCSLHFSQWSFAEKKGLTTICRHGGGCLDRLEATTGIY